MDDNAETAFLAGGCAWIMQPLLSHPKGVISTRTAGWVVTAITRPRITTAATRRPSKSSLTPSGSRIEDYWRSSSRSTEPTSPKPSSAPSTAPRSSARVRSNRQGPKRDPRCGRVWALARQDGNPDQPSRRVLGGWAGTSRLFGAISGRLQAPFPRQDGNPLSTPFLASGGSLQPVTGSLFRRDWSKRTLMTRTAPYFVLAIGTRLTGSLKLGIRPPLRLLRKRSIPPGLSGSSRSSSARGRASLPSSRTLPFTGASTGQSDPTGC